MAEYTHGGDILSAQAQCPGEVLDFSANLNLLGMPESVRRAAEAAIARSIHYPDPYCRELTAAIAAADGVTPDMVLCGNGAADLIFRLAFALRPRRALVTAPTFSEYRQAAEAAGCAVEHHLLSPENDFALTEDILSALTPELDMLFLCNPNNPTGQPIDGGLLEKILARCRETGIRLVVDECFLDLTDDGMERTLVPFLAEFPDLVLLRAFTKSYAMPGLRLGYCLTADRALLEALTLCAQPWSVSAPAQAAGVAALADPEHPARARAIIPGERDFLTRGLKELGLRVFPSRVNYLLFQAPGIADLKERLIPRGILIRSCSNYEGLGPDYYRIAVRPRAEKARLLQVLKEVL